jgi:hypothetical protein
VLGQLVNWSVWGNMALHTASKGAGKGKDGLVARGGGQEQDSTGDSREALRAKLGSEAAVAISRAWAA